MKKHFLSITIWTLAAGFAIASEAAIIEFFYTVKEGGQEVVRRGEFESNGPRDIHLFMTAFEAAELIQNQTTESLATSPLFVKKGDLVVSYDRSSHQSVREYKHRTRSGSVNFNLHSSLDPVFGLTALDAAMLVHKMARSHWAPYKEATLPGLYFQISSSHAISIRSMERFKFSVVKIDGQRGQFTVRAESPRKATLALQAAAHYFRLSEMSKIDISTLKLENRLPSEEIDCHQAMGTRSGLKAPPSAL
jgi:hypothetical protein